MDEGLVSSSTSATHPLSTKSVFVFSKIKSPVSTQIECNYNNLNPDFKIMVEERKVKTLLWVCRQIHWERFSGKDVFDPCRKGRETLRMRNWQLVLWEQGSCIITKAAPPWCWRAYPFPFLHRSQLSLLLVKRFGPSLDASIKQSPEKGTASEQKFEIWTC